MRQPDEKLSDQAAPARFVVRVAGLVSKWTGGSQMAVAGIGLLAVVLGAGGVLPLAVTGVVAGLAAGLLALCQTPEQRTSNGAAVLDSAALPKAGAPDRREGGYAPPAASFAAAGEPGWRSVIDALVDPTVALDGEDVVVHFNPVAADIFPQLRVGVPLSQVSRSPELFSGVERARAGDDKVVVELQDRVPVERRLSAIVSRLATSAERLGVPKLLIVFRDISDQERMAQMRADFIANASHELRTPLASLKGAVETLQGPARNDEAARDRFLATMANQAARMARLIDDLLLLSRTEMSVHLPPRGTVDIADVLGDVVETLEPMAQANDVQLVYEPPTDVIEVRGERDELVQAFLNLVQNAIKYGRQGGTVEVRVTRGGARGDRRKCVLVAVIDDGPGIAAEHLDRLTERFYRVNVAHSREKGGTGLGLAIVKYIVTRHRGELRISSQVGKGSVFAVAIEELVAFR